MTFYYPNTPAVGPLNAVLRLKKELGSARLALVARERKARRRQKELFRHEPMTRSEYRRRLRMKIHRLMMEVTR